MLTLTLSVAEYNGIPLEKRKFVYEYICHMEGSWGDLAVDDIREWHYRVLRECGVPAFATALEAEFESAWELSATHRHIVSIGEPYRRLMNRAEGCFRDFHYDFMAPALPEAVRE